MSPTKLLPSTGCEPRSDLFGRVRQRDQRGPHAQQALLDLMRNLRHFGIAGHLQHGHGVHERDHQLAIGLFAHHHIARQQQADVGLCPQRPERQWRIAGGGLQAPRMQWGRMSTPSLAFIVAWMSISVSTPNP